MDDVEIQDAGSAESSPAESTAPAQDAATSQATTTQPVKPAEPPFHQHPRFQQLTGQNRQLRDTVTQLTQRLTQLESRADQRGGTTADEQRQYQEAGQALQRIIEANPDLQYLLKLRQLLPQLSQGYQGVQHLQQQAVRQQMASARTHIEGLVKDAGINIDKPRMAHVVRMVAGAAMNLPDGDERYQAGDLSVLNEAFEDVKGFIEGLRKDGTARVASTKQQVKSLPPRTTGGAAGTPAPEQLVPGKEREYETNMHKRGSAMLKELLGG